MIELLSNTGFIMYNKALAHLLGVNEAILVGELCAKYQYWLGEGSLLKNDGWFYITAKDIHTDTGLTPYQQRNAISKLRDAGILETRLADNPARLYFHLMENMLYNLLSRNCTTRCQETAQLDVKKLDNYYIGITKKETKKETKNKNICGSVLKHPYGEFQKVLLSDEEYSKLVQRLGKDGAGDYIDRLDGWLAEGHSKKNHYATILNWWRKDGGVPAAEPEITHIPCRERTAEEIRNMSVEELIDCADFGGSGSG